MALRGVRARIITIFMAVAALLGGLGYAVAQVSRAPAGRNVSSVDSARGGSSGGNNASTSLSPASPGISSVQAANGYSWGSSTVSASLPSSVTAGDLLIAEITTRGGSTTITPPSGWAQAGSLTTYPGTMDTGIFYDVAGGPASSFSFALSSSQAWAYTLREWNSSTGWQSAPLDVTAGDSTGSSTTLDSGTTGTTAQATELVVAALAWNSAGQSESGLTSGFTSGELGSAGGTISVREAYQVTGATGTFDAQETISAAEWNASTIAAFLPVQTASSPSPSPSPSPTPSPSPSPTPSPSPAPGSCASQLSGSNVVSLDNGLYHLQANEWNSSAAFTVCNDGNVDFDVSSSSISNSTSGAPGAYPSLYLGCHWGDCTSGGGLPVLVSAMDGGGVVSTSYSTSTTGSGAYDDSYDIWFNQASSTSDNSTNGLELMIWLNHNGSVQPAGSEVASDVSIGGNTYDVWYNGTSPGGTVSYVLANPVTSVSNLDLGPLAADAVARGYMPASWYLIDVEAGFEIWQGGQGLTANSFSVSAG